MVGETIKKFYEMEFVTITPNRSRINEISEKAVSFCSKIDAAIAYISDAETLISHARNKKIPLNIYARYDYSIPVDIKVMKQFLGAEALRMSMHLVSDRFHPKIIWWRDFGVYIGSANLTKRAWFENYEAGVFITEEEVYSGDCIAKDLEDFFSRIDEDSVALTDGIVDFLSNIDRERYNEELNKIIIQFKNENLVPPPRGLHDIVHNRNAFDKKRNKFIKEWNESLEIMRAISLRVADENVRPKWVQADVPANVQADQFLHAFYYKRIADGRSYPFDQFYHQNKNRKEEALSEALRWWNSLENGVEAEDLHMHEWAPFVKRNLSREKIRTLEQDEFYETCLRIHALSDHANRIDWSDHNLYPKKGLDRKERVCFFVKWLLEQKNRNGDNVLELIYYVIHGGNDSNIAHRLFEASFEADYKIPHISVSTLGEMIGWALPDRFPPRNGRTSKALRALGYDVTIHSG